MPFIVVLVTTPSENEALKIVNKLLEEKLIACANIIEKVHSKFWWHKKVEDSYESLVIMKTHSKLFNELTRTVKKLHSYEVPEIIALSIAQGSASYLDWIRASIRKV